MYVDTCRTCSIWHVMLSKPCHSFSLSNNVLDMTGSIEEIGDMRWPLLGTLIFSWLVVYFCLFKGIKSSGKVLTYFLFVTFPSLSAVFAGYTLVHVAAKTFISADTLRFQYILIESYGPQSDQSQCTKIYLHVFNRSVWKVMDRKVTNHNAPKFLCHVLVIIQLFKLSNRFTFGF